MADNDEKDQDEATATRTRGKRAAKKGKQQFARGREEGDDDDRDPSQPIDEAPFRGGVYQNTDGDHIDSEGRFIDPESGEPLDEREAAIKAAQARADEMTRELEEAQGEADDVDEDDDEIELGTGNRRPAPRR